MTPKLILIVALFASVVAFVTADSFAVGVPITPINAEVQKEIPLIEQDIRTIKLPENCCYDDVGMSHVHLNMQGFHIDQSSVSASLSVACDAQSMTASFAGALTVDMFVRLCLHDDPFSSHACSTLYNCKGDTVTVLHGAGDVPLKISADASGMLAVVAGTPVFSASIPSTNLCGKIHDQISAQLSKIDAAVQTQMAQRIPTLIQTLLQHEPHPVINTSLPFDVHWDLTAGTRTAAGAVVLQGDLTVLAHAQGDKPGPFTPRAPLPDVTADIPAGSSVSVIALADSVVSNAVWAVVQQVQPAFNFSTHVLGQNLTVGVTLSQSPQVLFDSNGTSVVSSVDMNVALQGVGDLFAATVDCALSANMTVNQTATAAATVTLQVGFEYLTVNITQTHGMPVDPSLVQHLLDTALTTMILPKVNDMLAQSPIPIPHLTAVSLSDFTLSYGEGYLLITADMKFPAASSPLERYKQQTLSASHNRQGLHPAEAFWQLLRAPLPPVTCPNIPGAHQDGCI